MNTNLVNGANFVDIIFPDKIYSLCLISWIRKELMLICN